MCCGIKVYDKSDPNAEDANVLWSWHIWCTEKPDIIELGLPTNGEKYSGKNYKIMDRDLGATTNIPDKLTTCGLGYQWGRKDPFIGMASFYTYTSLDNLEPKNAPMYNVRGTKQELKEEMSNESTGTIEYAIKHPNVFIRASSDWLYYKEMFGNQYLWGNNPYSRYKMVDIETMKTIYDPCPAGYKISPPDVYGAFLKEPIIMYSLTDDDFTPNIIGHVGEMKAKSFYTPSFTEYGAYFYCGGENSARKVYFISAGIRLADVYEVQPGYIRGEKRCVSKFGRSENI